MVSVVDTYVIMFLVKSSALEPELFCTDTDTGPNLCRGLQIVFKKSSAVYNE
jgi:hypothetical protein